MLQHGAAAVVAIDTGYGQIAHKLRVDARVTLLERTNARHLESATGRIAGYVSARWMFRSSRRRWCCRRWCAAMRATADWRMVVLVKPQFEAGREHVGKGGIVRDAEGHATGGGAGARGGGGAGR